MKRSDIVVEARRWKGIKWQHQQCLFGVACDCVGLVRGVYENLTGIKIPVIADYPATWHLFRSEPWLYNECKANVIEIPVDEAKEGDLLTFSMREKFPDHHIAILTGDNTIIHSYMDVGKVVESSYNHEWQGWTKHAFRYPGVED